MRRSRVVPSLSKERAGTTCSSIVPAAGRSRRARTTASKLLARLGNQPLLWYSLQALERCGVIGEVVVVARKEEAAAIRGLCRRARLRKVRVTSPGGATRQESVWVGLLATDAGADLIAVHDAARPFLAAEVLERCVREAARRGAAIAAAPCGDTLKATNGRTISRTLKREGVWLAQTPQVFRRELLLKAHRRARRYGYTATDDAELVQRLGHEVRVVPSSSLNLKVTTPADLEMAGLLARDGARLRELLGW